jgi:replication-associated recombination protein RarA
VNQEYLPDALQGHQFFEAGSSPKEKEIAEALKLKFNKKYPS